MTEPGRICTQQERELIILRDLGKCRYCGSENQPFHIDHVYPHSLGGITKIENLVTSCQRCNQKKHNSVGTWPKPIGYFSKKNYRLALVSESKLLLGILCCLSGLGFLSMSDFTWLPRILISCGVVILCSLLLKINTEVVDG